MHFPLVSDSPLYFRKISLTLWKIFPISPFPIKRFRFSSSNFVFSHRSQISNFLLYLALLVHFPLNSAKSFILPPTLPNFSPDFVTFRCFVHAFCDFRFPLLLP